MRKINLKSVMLALYAAVCILFVVLTVYMCAFEKSDIYSAREYPSFTEFRDYSVNEIKASDAPQGIKKVYSWENGEINSGENCLIFYLVHSYVDVKIGDSTVYSLAHGKNNVVGKSPSSNWIVVPLSPLDSFKEVTVTVTPVFKSVTDREISFKIGTRYAVFVNQLKSDLPQIIISSLCILIGIVMIIAQMYLVVKKRTTLWNVFFLGNFSVFLGVWRITDTRFSSVMFKNYSMALGYITIAALFIAAVPLLIYADSLHPEKKHILLRVAAITTSVAVAAALLCQIFGIAELHDMLKVCHIMLIIDVVVLIISLFVYKNRDECDLNTKVFILMLTVGCVSDIAYYYAKGSSSGMMITLTLFLIYTVYQFGSNILSINKRAYIDPKTKLFNRAYWYDLVEMNISPDDSIGMMMFDLNGLKRTNDTLGHNSGDDMIMGFSSILKKVIGTKEFLCRWGGDEFTVLIKNADREKAEGYISAVQAEVDKYNSSGRKPEIHFACGYALSVDYPTHSCQELLDKADEYMYRDKRRWYSERKA